jgi:hypothetical protein
MASGGYRAGSGRKAMPEHEKKVTMTVWVAPTTGDYLKNAAREAGLGIGAVVESIIEDYKTLSNH